MLEGALILVLTVVLVLVVAGGVVAVLALSRRSADGVPAVAPAKC